MRSVMQKSEETPAESYLGVLAHERFERRYETAACCVNE